MENIKKIAFKDAIFEFLKKFFCPNWD